MQKIRIGDLTLDKLYFICENHTCWTCPLSFNCDCLFAILDENIPSRIKEALNKYVEVSQ